MGGMKTKEAGRARAAQPQVQRVRLTNIQARPDQQVTTREREGRTEVAGMRILVLLPLEAPDSRNRSAYLSLQVPQETLTALNRHVSGWDANRVRQFVNDWYMRNVQRMQEQYFTRVTTRVTAGQRAPRQFEYTPVAFTTVSIPVRQQPASIPPAQQQVQQLEPPSQLPQPRPTRPTRPEGIRRGVGLPYDRLVVRMPSAEGEEGIGAQPLRVPFDVNIQGFGRVCFFFGISLDRLTPDARNGTINELSRLVGEGIRYAARFHGRTLSNEGAVTRALATFREGFGEEITSRASASDEQGRYLRGLPPVPPAAPVAAAPPTEVEAERPTLPAGISRGTGVASSRFTIQLSSVEGAEEGIGTQLFPAPLDIYVQGFGRVYFSLNIPFSRLTPDTRGGTMDELSRLMGEGIRYAAQLREREVGAEAITSALSGFRTELGGRITSRASRDDAQGRYLSAHPTPRAEVTEEEVPTPPRPEAPVAPTVTSAEITAEVPPTPEQVEGYIQRLADPVFHRAAREAASGWNHEQLLAVYDVCRTWLRNELDAHRIPSVYEGVARGRSGTARYLLEDRRDNSIRDYNLLPAMDFIFQIQRDRAAASRQEMPEGGSLNVVGGEGTTDSPYIVEIPVQSTTSYREIEPPPLRTTNRFSVGEGGAERNFILRFMPVRVDEVTQIETSRLANAIAVEMSTTIGSTIAADSSAIRGVLRTVLDAETTPGSAINGYLRGADAYRTQEAVEVFPPMPTGWGVSLVREETRGGRRVTLDGSTEENAVIVRVPVPTTETEQVGNVIHHTTNPIILQMRGGGTRRFFLRINFVGQRVSGGATAPTVQPRQIAHAISGRLHPLIREIGASFQESALTRPRGPLELAINEQTGAVVRYLTVQGTDRRNPRIVTVGRGDVEGELFVSFTPLNLVSQETNVYVLVHLAGDVNATQVRDAIQTACEGIAEQLGISPERVRTTISRDIRGKMGQIRGRVQAYRAARSE